MADFNETFNDFNNTEDTTTQFDPNDIQQNKVMSIFAYLSWLVLVPIFGAKNSPFARFHINQGLVLAIVEIACWVVFGILGHVPGIRWIAYLAESAVSVVCVVFSVIGIVNAASGRAKELPIVGSFRILK